LINHSQLREEFYDLGFQQEWDAAEKLNNAWNEKFPPGFWGKHVTSEAPSALHPEMLTTLSDLWGVRAFTFRVDWITRITGDDALAINTAVPELGRVSAGLYLHDYKTASSAERDPTGYYSADPQVMSYPHSWNALFPDNPCQGMILHRIVNTKLTQFQHTYIPATPTTEQIVRGWLQCTEMLGASDAPLGIASNCRTFFRPCQHLTSGLCDRTWTKE